MIGRGWVLAAVLVLGGVSGGTARADGASGVPYQTLAEWPLGFQALPEGERDRLVMQERLVKTDGITPWDPAPTIHYELDGVTKSIPVEADGRFVLPLDPALRAANPTLRSGLPKGQSRILVEVLLVPPPEPVMPLAWYQAGARQAEAAATKALRASAGFLATLIAPSAKAVELHYPPGATTTVTLRGPAVPTGEQILRPRADGTVRIDLVKPPDPETTLVVPAAPPLTIEPRLE